MSSDGDRCRDSSHTVTSLHQGCAKYLQSTEGRQALGGADWSQVTPANDFELGHIEVINMERLGTIK